MVPWLVSKSEDERGLRFGLECLRSPLCSSKGNVMPVYTGCSQFSYWKQKVSDDTNSFLRQVLLFRFRLSELPVGLSLGWFLPPARETRVCFLPVDHLHLFPFHSWTFFFFLSLKHHFRLFVSLTNNSQLDYWLVYATRNTSNREDVFCHKRLEHGCWWLLIEYEITSICMEFTGFPDGKESACQMQKTDMWVQSLGREGPLE